jgi:sugar phosphate isomerase/epimerase
MQVMVKNNKTGSDEMTISQATEFFKGALVVIDKILKNKVSISFETHRGRILYSPWVALDLVERFPALKFTLDLSHWVIVSERLIDITKILPILKNTLHLHLRLGTRQSSQVSNPVTMDVTIKEYFEECWRLAVGYGAMTGCLEYGPVEYQPVGFDGKVEMELETLIALESKRLSTTFI